MNQEGSAELVVLGLLAALIAILAAPLLYDDGVAMSSVSAEVEQTYQR